MDNVIRHPAFNREPVINTRKLGGCLPQGVRVLSRYRRDKKTQEAEPRVQADFNGAKAKEARQRRLAELREIRDDCMRRAFTMCGMIVELEQEER